MLKVFRPSVNKITQGYKSSHRGYDFDGEDLLIEGDEKGNQNVYAPFYGKITLSKGSETRNWLANTSSDPHKDDPRRPSLITEDYGNYCKLKGEVDGKTVYCLLAHMEAGSVAKRGTEVKEGEIIGKIGNTGNSTGKHLHSEFRDASNENFQVGWKEKEEQDEMEQLPKDSIIRDIYKVLAGEYPSEDEVNARIQANQNLQQIIESIVTVKFENGKQIAGDHRFYETWIKPHIPEQDVNKDKLLSTYRDTIYSIKEVLRREGLEAGADSETMIAKMEWVVDELNRLREEKKPDTIYKVEGKEFNGVTFGNLLIGILKRGD